MFLSSLYVIVYNRTLAVVKIALKPVLIVQLSRIWVHLAHWWRFRCRRLVEWMHDRAVRRCMSRKILSIQQWMFIVTTYDEGRFFYWMAGMQIWPQFIVELTCTFIMGLFVEAEMVTWLTFIFQSVEIYRNIKGSSDRSHLIFVNVGKRPIRYENSMSESFNVGAASFRHWFQK